MAIQTFSQEIFWFLEINLGERKRFDIGLMSEMRLKLVKNTHLVRKFVYIQ